MEASLGPSSLLAQVSTLRYPPSSLQSAHFREIFNRLSPVETLNYTVTGEGVELVTPPRESGETTKIAVTRESVAVSFDPLARSAGFASEQLVAILKEVTAVLPVPVFVHQTHVLRKTWPLTGRQDSRTFLLNEVLHIPAERMAGWKRGFAAVGLRFVFPPQQAGESQHLSAHDLKVESYLPDAGKLYAENTATFLVPLPAGQWDALKANLDEANRFLDEHAQALLRGQPSLPGEA